MKTSHSILQLLATDQATTAALAHTLAQPPIVIAAFCLDLESAGHVTSHALGREDKGRKLATWRITPAGREIISQPATA